MIILKNGYTTDDLRLNRIPKFDERSRLYRVVDLVPKNPRSYTWACVAHLDQGREGACVGFGITHELLAKPVVAKGLDAKYAKEQIYWPAQRADGWPGGSYPGANPFYEGTAVIDGIKVAQKIGWYTGYSWSFSVDELILGIGYSGPAILGIPWYDGMSSPDRSGIIHATGKQVGGHCILCNGVNIKSKLFRLHNSWGTDWGSGGDCFISFDDMDKILHNDGEASFPTGRKLV